MSNYQYFGLNLTDQKMPAFIHGGHAAIEFSLLLEIMDPQPPLGQHEAEMESQWNPRRIDNQKNGKVRAAHYAYYSQRQT